MKKTDEIFSWVEPFNISWAVVNINYLLQLNCVMLKGDDHK